MATVIRENYAWRSWSEGDLQTPSCVMVAYRTWDDGSQNQVILEGEEKQDAISVVELDRSRDEPAGNYSESTVSEDERVYLRTSKRTGNSWECKLDEDGDPIPHHCNEEKPNTDLERGSVILSEASVVMIKTGDKVTMTIMGRLV